MMKLISWSWISKKAWGKRKERVFRRGSWLIHHLQNMSHQKYKHTDKVPSTSSQIVEQIEVIQKIAFLGISSLNNSAPDTKQGDQTQFLPKQALEKGKRKMDLIFSNYICYHTNW